MHALAAQRSNNAKPTLFKLEGGWVGVAVMAEDKCYCSHSRLAMQVMQQIVGILLLAVLWKIACGRRVV